MIHTKNGSEFSNADASSMCDLEHIKLGFSAPYVPEQNRAAERKNWTIIETARTLLSNSGLPKPLWAEATNTAVYLRNRMPKSGSKVAPYELFRDRKPYIDHIVPFGTEVHSLISERRIGKFDPKTAGYVVGFTDRISNYRILIRDTMKVKISCDLIFRPQASRN